MNNAAYIADADPVQVIAVTSGNEGAGKTSVAVNLATALANRGHRAMLLDGNVGLADVGMALGLHPTWDLGHLIRGERRLEEILLRGPSGLAIVPAVAGSGGIAELSAAESVGVIAAFSELTRPPDVLVVDTATEPGDGNLRIIQAAGEVLVVVDDQDSSIGNAYRLLRILRRQAGLQRFRVLTNRIRGGETPGRALFDRLARLADRELDVALHFVGTVPDDVAVRRALGRRQPAVNAFPASAAARAFKHLARRTENWAPPSYHNGGVAFFVERLIGSTQSMQLQAVN